MRISNIICLTALFFISCTAAREYTALDIKETKNYRKDCGTYYAMKRKAPDRSKLRISQNGNRIYLSAGSKSFYNSVIQKPTDGIALQLVERSTYSCDDDTAGSAGDTSKKGIFKVLLKTNLDTLRDVSLNPNQIALDLGELPADYDPEKNECNLMIIQKKYLCETGVFFNIDRELWQLLDMGIYKDSLRISTSGDDYSLNEKVLRFTIPYEKNDATISDSDLQPLYDSLDFSSYNVTSIDITAYASIEGDKALNEKLLRGRSRSVIRALQKYQKPEIDFSIDARENWEQFYSEIKRTSFSDMAEMDRAAIKAMFEGNEENLQKFEPLLARHRKADIIIKLRRKLRIQELGNDELVSVFNETVKAENVEKTEKLLDYVLKKFSESPDPEAYIEKLEIPPSSENGRLLNNIEGFVYVNNYQTDEESLYAFEELHRLFPLNKEILYNLIAIKMTYPGQAISKADLKQLRVLLDQLQITTLSPRLKYRPWINYYILSNEYYHQVSDFASSRRMIRNILSIYKNVLTYEDRLRIAKYLVHYAQYTDAEKILNPVIKNEDISDDVLFYYLNITIPFEKFYGKEYYDQLVSKAVTRDRERFCKLYRSANTGGVTFQLLAEEKLSKYYCEICE